LIFDRGNLRHSQNVEERNLVVFQCGSIADAMHKKTNCSYRILSAANFILTSTLIPKVNLVGSESQSDPSSLKEAERKLNLQIKIFGFSFLSLAAHE
jgi:hypothetical protein